MAGARLPIDASLLFYWGFDEANVADVGLDEATGAHHLTVTGATAVVPARIGNGRQFDGVNTIARLDAAGDTFFRSRWRGIGTIICWFTLDSMNAGGDLLRPVLTFEGPGGGAADATALGLYVRSNGALVLRYTSAAGDLVEYRTAANTIRVGRYYSLAVTMATPSTTLSASCWVNNEAVAWASLSVEGVPADPTLGSPLPPVSAGANCVLTVGAMQKSTSKWQGVLDELSIHQVARPYDAYLKAAYFRLALSTQFQRLTGLGNIRSLGSADMGGGTRWWCYERDQGVYVIRENTLGLFGIEVKLTSGGLLANGAEMPGGVEKPRLVYDAVSDVLLIVFVGAGKVWKIAATSQDAPATQVMPYAQDTALILKARDTADLVRHGMGEMNANPQPGSVGILVNAEQYPATVAFLGPPHHASFGVALYGSNPYGYNVYRTVGDVETLLGVGITLQTERVSGTNYWFVPISSRIDGAVYYARARDANGVAGRTVSNQIEDRLGVMVTGRDGLFDRQVLNRDGDAVGGVHDAADFSGGHGGVMSEYPIVVTGTPVKIGLTPESYAAAITEALLYREWGFVTAAPVKVLAPDSAALAVAMSNYVTMSRSDAAYLGIV